MGRHAEALESFDRATKIDPNSALAHCNKGTALAKMGRHAEAVKSYDRAIQLDPNNVVAHDGKADSLKQVADGSDD